MRRLGIALLCATDAVVCFAAVIAVLAIIIGTGPTEAFAQSALGSTAASGLGSPSGKTSKRSAKKPKKETELPCLSKKTKDNQAGQLGAGPYYDDGDAWSGYYQVLQIVDSDNAILVAHAEGPGYLEGQWTFWLHSPIVKTLKEDSGVKHIEGVFGITGRKRYVNGFGSRKTVDLVENVPDPRPTPRKWTVTTTHVTIDATFQDITPGGVVSLKKKDGKIIKVPLEKLNDEDRKWIKDRAKK